jgi:hypothetical protein
MGRKRQERTRSLVMETSDMFVSRGYHADSQKKRRALCEESPCLSE